MPRATAAIWKTTSCSNLLETKLTLKGMAPYCHLGAVEIKPTSSKYLCTFFIAIEDFISQ